jgi:hypothetical protein
VKGREDMPMRAMEDRLRDAFGAAAETVTALDLPGPPTTAGRSRAARGLQAWASRARMPALVPAAAAACVAVIIVTATLVVPRLLAGPPAGRAGSALAGAPRFFAGIANPPGQYPPSTVLNVYRSATGRVIASVRPPIPGHGFQAVARLGSDRTYVAAVVANHRNCTTRLYRFTVDPRGRPSRLTPLSVPQVTGTVAELVGSADGNVLAYTAGTCGLHGHMVAGVIHLATRQASAWPYPSRVGRRPATFGSLSLTADGSVLGFLAGPVSPLAAQEAWVLPTSAPPGPLAHRARMVLHLRTGVFRTLLNSTGSQMYLETLSALRGGVVVLGLYSTTTGKRIRLVGRLAPGGLNFAAPHISIDAARQQVLAYGYPDPSRVTVMNLTTGRRASITAAYLDVDGAITTVAW